MDLRESIARVVHPVNWEAHDAGADVQFLGLPLEPSLTKADSIIALCMAQVLEWLRNERPPEMTAESAPEWLRVLTPEEYAQRRNEENAEMIRSLEFHGDWMSVAASTLYSAGVWSGSEFGSYGHDCFIISDALMKVREKIMSHLVQGPVARSAIEQDYWDATAHLDENPQGDE